MERLSFRLSIPEHLTRTAQEECPRNAEAVSDSPVRLIPSEVKNAEILSKGSRIENSVQVNASRECSRNRRESEEKIEQSSNAPENISLLQTRILVRLDNEKRASDFKQDESSILRSDLELSVTVKSESEDNKKRQSDRSNLGFGQDTLDSNVGSLRLKEDQSIETEAVSPPDPGDGVGSEVNEEECEVKNKKNSEVLSSESSMIVVLPDTRIAAAEAEKIDDANDKTNGKDIFSNLALVASGMPTSTMFLFLIIFQISETMIIGREFYERTGTL